SRTALDVWRYHDANKEDRSTQLGHLTIPTAWPLEPPFHKLQVSVTPDAIDASFDGVALPQFTTAEVRNKFDLLKLARQVQDDCPDLQPEFGPTGGLGLYVSRSEASFHDVVVEPLP